MSKYTDLRVAWLAPGRGFSRVGGPRYTLPLLIEFQRAFPSVVYITTGKIDPYYHKILNIRSTGDVRTKELSSYPSGKYYRRSVNFLSPTVALDLLRLKPRIVISTEFYIWTILAVLLKPIGGWKVVILWTGSSPGVDLLDDPIRLSVRRFVAKRADAIITNSIVGKRYLENHLRVLADRVFRIVFKPGDSSPLTKKPTFHPLMQDGPHPRFLYVGQLIQRKGINHLLEAWSNLQRLSSNCGSLWIIGEGPQRDELLKQASALALKDVHFNGRVEYASLGSWYKACDVFVLPTLEDTWANVVPEAMTLGKPILCSKYAGTDELVRHGENGFVFEPSDTDELARLMLRLIDSPDLIERFGQKSREIMEPNTLTNAVEAFGDVMDLVLTSKRTKSGKRDIIGNVPKQRV